MPERKLQHEEIRIPESTPGCNGHRAGMGSSESMRSF